MLDRRSALASARPYASPVLQIGEARGFSLLQVAGPAKAISPITGKLPAKVGTALASRWPHPHAHRGKPVLDHRPGE